MGFTLAVSVVIAEVPPIFKVAPLPWVSPPEPLKAVFTVSVVLLVRVTPVTVTLGMEIAVVPPIARLFVSKVCTPVPAVKVVPLWVIPPRKDTASLAVLFHTPPGLMVTSPVNIFVPVVEEIVTTPVMLVAPETVVVTAPKVSVPVVTVNVPPMVVVPRKETPPDVLLMAIL